ncbi:MAG: tetratricopeptide repeat protein [Epsilonproteobacteria bacterium]|nr:tetratricopeptide repeat protein [Campylobacterota bacterium]
MQHQHQAPAPTTQGMGFMPTSSADQDTIDQQVPEIQKEQESGITLIEDSKQDKSHDYYLYFKGMYQHVKGKLGGSLKTFQELLLKSPSPYIYIGLFPILFDSGQWQKIVQFYTQKQTELTKLFDDNLELALIVSQSLLNLGRDDQAENLLANLTDKHPDDERVAYFVALSKIKRNEFDQAITFLDQCLAKKSLKNQHFLFYFLKSKVYLQQKKLPQALEEVEKSLKVLPKHDRRMLLKAVLLEQLGRVNEAIKCYKTFVDVVGNDSAVEQQLVLLLFSQKRFKEAAKHMKKISSSHPTYFFDLALLEFKAKNYSQALEHLNTALEKIPSFTRAKLLKVEILIEQKKFTDALQFLKDWIAQSPHDHTALHTLVLLQKAQVDGEQIIATLEDICKTATCLTMHATLAQLYFQHGRYLQARELYQKLLPNIRNNSIKAQMLFQVGYCYYLESNFAESEKTLEKALSHQPVYPETYNLLAYVYALHDKKLSESLSLVGKALETNPHSAYYLDTKGYILLKQGNKDEAEKLFKEALMFAPNDMIIKQHLLEAQK